MNAAYTDTRATIRVIVPVYRAGAVTVRCLESVVAALRFHPSWEILVVDNGGDNQLEKLLSPLPVKVIARTAMASAAYARNCGAADFYNGILVFIDSDVICEPDCIKNLTTILLDDRVDACTGNYSTDLKNLSFTQQYKQLYIHHSYSRSGDEIRNEFWTALSAVKASVFHALGGFDESFSGAAGEDTDFGVRLTRSGYKICFVKDALGQHLHHYTITGIIKNDFKKGIAAIRNSVMNKVPLSDNRHSNVADQAAVALACLALPMTFAGLFFTPLLSMTLFFLILWHYSRRNLSRLYRNKMTILNYLKSLALMFILDLLRAVCVAVGILMALKPGSRNHTHLPEKQTTT